MSLHLQLFWGSFYLALCCVLHVGILSSCVELLNRMSVRLGRLIRVVRNVSVLLVAVVMVVASHTAQIWLWAAALRGIGPLSDWNTSVYFSLVTYTSLGYGDVVLGPGARLFGAFASMTGLLTFGLSTAFLVAMMSRIFRDRLS